MYTRGTVEYFIYPAIFFLIQTDVLKKLSDKLISLRKAWVEIKQPHHLK